MKMKFLAKIVNQSLKMVVVLEMYVDNYEALRARENK